MILDFFVCKQKTAYELRIRDWSSDVCSSDLAGRAGDDQRGERLVDQDRVDFVDDREVEAALEPVVLRQRHVVAQVVEADLVVGGIGDVGGVGGVLVRM